MKILKRIVLCLFTAMSSHAALAFNPDSSPLTIGSICPPIGNSYFLAESSTTNQVFLGSYQFIPTWSGNLTARTIRPNGTIRNAINWSARDRLDSASVTPDNRKIITFTQRPNGTFKKVPFQWDELSPRQKTALGGSKKLLDFIRGDRSTEITRGGPYRNRDSRLGDIMHSVPLYWSYDNRGVLFVGANDGMLHAFDDQTGKELFAYIPSLFVSGDGSSNSAKLTKLTSNPYTHQYFVDGQIAARTLKGKSILIGGLGGGGKGLFALDVTKENLENNKKNTESTLAEKILLWEVTNESAGYANLGHTYATPVMVTISEEDLTGYINAPPPASASVNVGEYNGANGPGFDDNDDRVVALVPNGYNSTNGVASLFLIKPRTGEVIKEIIVNSGGASRKNGLSSITTSDVNLDGRVDFAYAGDLNGNLWKINLVSAAVTKLYTTQPRQPITMAPAVTYHPLGGQMILFATGKLFVDSDAKNTDTHYAYGIWDRPAKWSTNSTLFEQTLIERMYTGTSPSKRVRVTSGGQPDWLPGKDFGWKAALPRGGERALGEGSFVAGSAFVFVTTNPTTAGGRENWWMQLNALTGGADSYTERFDLNNDGQFSPLDQFNNKRVVGLYIGKGVRSQLTVFSTASGSSAYYGNANYNPVITTTTTTTIIPAPPSGPDRGVSNGHFDADAYSSNAKIDHVHEYDEDYDATGVNMLNPGNGTLKLSNIISSGVNFKVIAANQYLNPAVELHIGNSSQPGYVPYQPASPLGYIPISTYSTQAKAKDLLDALPSYNLSSIQSLAINMPMDAFSKQNWWGTTGIPALPADHRVGLHPTKTGCVNGGSQGNGDLVNALTRASDNKGVLNNGALVIQVIRADTPAGMLELNVSGRPEYGWRVKLDKQSNYLLAKYTVFWHHPNNACFSDSHWRKDPPEDSGAGGGGSSSSGTDPKVRSYGPRVTPGTGGGTGDGSSSTTTRVNPDGSVTITITTKNADGSTTIREEHITTTSDSTSTEDEPCTVDGASCTSPAVVTGRVNWRELRQ